MRTATVLALLLLAPAARAQAPADTAVPFVYDDARVWVSVRAGGGPPHPFILDTGAGEGGLDDGLARTLGVALHDTSTIEAVGRNPLHVARATVPGLRMGAVPLAATELLVSPLDSLLAPYTGRPAEGIVGGPFFATHVVTLDFARETLTVRAPEAFAYRGSGTVLPFRLVNGLPVVEGTLTLAGAGTVPVRLLVDLGAKATLLVSEAFMARVNVAPTLAAGVTLPLGAGLGGETHYRFARVPRLTIGAAGAVAADSIVAGFSVDRTLRATWYDALLGAEFLARWRVTFDYARARLILEPRAPLPPAAELDMSGMYLIAGRGAARPLTVYTLVDGGPAAAAGLRVGDRLVRVDGEAAERLTLGAIRDRLRAGAGRRVRLDLVRDGAPVTVMIVLRRLV